MSDEQQVARAKNPDAKPMSGDELRALAADIPGAAAALVA